mgnify:CR=1 FL=1
MAGEQSQFVVCCHCSGINKLPITKINKEAKCGKCKTALFPGQVYNLNQNNFSRFLEKNTLPIVVDFWASWCGPCKMMAPVFEKVATAMSHQAFFFKVNTEEQQALSAQFEIRSIPTLILFKQGREVDRQAGAMDEGRLSQWVKYYT